MENQTEEEPDVLQVATDAEVGIQSASRKQAADQQQPRNRFEKMNATRQLSPAQTFETLRQFQQHEDHQCGCDQHSIWGKYHAECPHCAARNRAYLRQVRTIAKDYPNIYSRTYLDTKIFREGCWEWPHPKEIFLVLLAISVQVFLPVAIGMQLYDNLVEQHDVEGISKSTLCPQNSNKWDSVGKSFAFVLSALFGVVSTANFLGKVRGNTLLLFFSPLSPTRRGMIMVGLAAEILGLLAANVAEYLLFVNRGSADFLTLLFTSLTMQSTLNADSVFLSSEQKDESSDLIDIILADEVLQVGESGEMMHKPVGNLVHNFRRAYDLATLVMVLFSVFLTVSVTKCI